MDRTLPENERETLMEILRDRVDYHKDKIISKTITMNYVV